jgi:hypothetical protein
VSVDATISGVSMTSNSYYYNNSGTASFTLNVNGSSNYFQAKSIGASNYYTGTLGQFYVYSTSEEIDSTDVALVVWVTPYSGNNTSCPQYKQMGMIQNTSTGKVRAVIEAVGYESSCSSSSVLPTGAALISSLQSVMQ